MSLAKLVLEGRTYKVNLNRCHDLSIPVRFDQKSFKAFGARGARKKPYLAGSTPLHVQTGAGCNCPVFTFSAHLHGTHTECVGHISRQIYVVQDLLESKPFQPALVVTLESVGSDECGETYLPKLSDGDQVLTQKAIQEALDDTDPVKALVIRTLPNGPEKTSRNYDSQPAPYFTNEAMEYLKESGVEHLLVDMPSVDRLEDEGRLSNHHIFWGVSQGSNDVPEPSSKTITEFIYVPKEVKDGIYLLALNISNIRADAAPSRPTLYEIQKS